MTIIKVAIVGATGGTGQSITKGLLESPDTKFEITAITRPSSLSKPEFAALKERGVKIVAADLHGPEADLVKLLEDIDVVISAINAMHLSDDVLLANAAKKAGVKRFVPCFFATVMPPKGIMQPREVKEDNLSHIKKIRLPYTVIDVGWWMQIAIPKLASGRVDYVLSVIPFNTIGGDGNVPMALTDVNDIGRYVARVIADPRTLNKMVSVYGELHTQNQVIEMMEKLSGEKIEVTRLPKEVVLATLAEAQKTRATDQQAFFTAITMEYLHSWAIRGDDNPEYAEYLGYLDGKKLYPDLKTKTLEEVFQEVLDGKATFKYMLGQ